MSLKQKAATTLRYVMLLFFIAGATLLINSDAFSADSDTPNHMPQIDIKLACISYVQRSRLGPQAVEMCIEDEERAKWRLSLLWAKASPSTIKNCNDADIENIRKNNPYRYTNYADCIYLFTEQEKARSQYGLPPLPNDFVYQKLQERNR